MIKIVIYHFHHLLGYIGKMILMKLGVFLMHTHLLCDQLAVLEKDQSAQAGEKFTCSLCYKCSYFRVMICLCSSIGLYSMADLLFTGSAQSRDTALSLSDYVQGISGYYCTLQYLFNPSFGKVITVKSQPVLHHRHVEQLSTTTITSEDPVSIHCTREHAT